MDFYLKEEDIHKELEKRQSDKSLVKKIEEYLGEELPEPFNDQSKNFAILFRHVFTPDYEIEKFLEKAKKLNLEPVLIEYKEDKFVPENEDKKTLAKMPFFRGIFKDNEIKFDIFKIIDFDSHKSKRISEIITFWNEPLIDFHHRILESYYPETLKNIFDYSEWFHCHGCAAKNYYYNFLALFLSNAVLFDNFRNEGKEGEFCRDIFEPAVYKIKEVFGLLPMICPIQSIEDENNPKWWGYDLNKKEKIIQLSKEYKKVD
jgi:hypothetical protein